MKKLTCNLLLTCDQTILSKDNKISLIGIFDQIFVPELPGHHPKLSLVGIVTGEPFADHTLIISFKDPSSKPVYPDQNVTVNLGTTGKSNLVAEFVNLPLNSTGVYIFSLHAGKSLLASTQLSVSKVQTPNLPRSKVVN